MSYPTPRPPAEDTRRYYPDLMYAPNNPSQRTPTLMNPHAQYPVAVVQPQQPNVYMYAPNNPSQRTPTLMNPHAQYPVAVVQPQQPNVYLHAPRPMPPPPRDTSLLAGHRIPPTRFPDPEPTTTGPSLSEQQRRMAGVTHRLDTLALGTHLRSDLHAGRDAPVMPVLGRREPSQEVGQDYCSHPAYHESNIPERGLAPSMSRLPVARAAAPVPGPSRQVARRGAQMQGALMRTPDSRRRRSRSRDR